MELRKRLFNQLPEPNYRAKMINGWQNTQNIIDAIKYQHAANLPEAKKIAKYFQGSNEKETARNIWNFLKREMVYEVESGDKQTTKSLSRYLADGKGDCKHLSIFANTILQSLGYRAVYRFAGYGNKGLQHVYTYLPKTNLVLDAVMPSFDTEKTYTTKKDIDMGLYRLSGIDDTDEISGINFSKIKDNIKKAAAKSSSAIKKAASQIPAAAKKLAQGMKTVGLAAPRTAFIALVRLNFRGLATDLKTLIDKKGFAGIEWWKDLGGDRTTLTEVVNAGSKMKRILGIEEESAARYDIYGGYSGDGVNTMGEPVTIAASLATAAPILQKVYNELEKSGVLKNLAAAKDIVKSANAGFEAATGKKVTDVVFKKEPGIVTTMNSLTKKDLQPLELSTAAKLVVAAVAQGSGVDVATIKEVAAELPKSAYTPTDGGSFITPSTFPQRTAAQRIEQTSPFTPNEGGNFITPNTFVNRGGGVKLPTISNKTLMIGGAVVIGLFLLLKRK